MTSDPAFKPETWVLYELEDGTAGYGNIAGAATVNSSWTYLLKGSSASGEPLQIPEHSVKFILENGNWTAPSNFTGSNSAYASSESA